MILFNKDSGLLCFSAFILYNFYKYNEKNARVYYYLNHKIEELERKNECLDNKFQQIKFSYLISNVRTWERSLEYEESDSDEESDIDEESDGEEDYE